MEKKIIVAVPTNAPGGLEAELSGHFGHCDVFTIVEIDDGKIGDVSIQGNVSHEQGGCMVPVNILADRKANVLIAGGMGMRPLMGFNSVGIEVFHNNGLSRVDHVISAFVEGKLQKFSQDNVCGGGGDHSGGGEPGGCGG